VCSRGARFESRSGHRLSDISHGFRHFLQAIAGIVPRTGQYQFVPNPFQFIIHLSSYHPMLSSRDSENSPLNNLMKKCSCRDNIAISEKEKWSRMMNSNAVEHSA
jgi:hypothetical protein